MRTEFCLVKFLSKLEQRPSLLSDDILSFLSGFNAGIMLYFSQVEVGTLQFVCHLTQNIRLKKVD